MAGTLANTAKQSGLQLIIAAMEKLLSPLTEATKKGLLQEYLDSLGIKDQNLTAGGTDKVKAFLAKKAEEADTLSFLAALKQQTDLIRGLKDLVERNVPRDAQPFEKKRLINDLTTSLINIFAMEYFRVKVPLLHNIFMGFYSLNNFNNRGDGAIGIGDMVGEYAKRWVKSFNLENADEARRLSEVFFVVGTVMAYLFNSSLSENASREDISTRLLLGGQFGNEAIRKTELTTPRDFINDLLGRTFELSISREKGSESGEMSATFVILSKEDGSSGVDVLIKDNLANKSLRLSENWFFAYDVAGSMQFVAGGNNTDGDVDLKSSKLKIAFERLIFAKNVKPEDILIDHDVIKKLFTYFSLGFGNLSLQLEASPRDLAFTFVVQVIYAITNSKVEDGKEVKGGFPFKFLPNVKNVADVPLRFSIKDHFGFSGGFIGERPPDPTPASLTPSAPSSLLPAAAGPAPADPQAVASGKAGTFSIPIHKDLGPVRFDKMNIGFVTGKDIGVELTMDFTLKLGPIVISIAGMGTGFSAKKRTEEPVEGGILGYDVVPSFVPPSGAGIVVDAEAVKGGGFLFFDDKKGEYFGAIELTIKELITLNAVGIIRTRDDQGRDMFSFLILITSEFQPVQLGFGFTLNGVGGLIGINRTVNVQFIQEGLTNNVLDSILFPKDVVGNINKIITNLGMAFPLKDNSLVIGIMAKLGWGTPTQVSADIGVIFGQPVSIIGVLRANFPSEQLAILKLKIAFIGILDFKNEFIFFRADLIDSRILSFRLTGSWVIAICWGANSVFVYSAGGFNPRFKEIPKIPTLPNAFNNLQRIGLHLLDSDNPRLLVETYFAITSNTVQVGGKAEMIYDIAFGYNVYGRLEVHALFTFNPFHFIFDLLAEIALRDGTDWVMGIRLKGFLEGPGPWHIKGSATVETPWYLPDIDVDLDYSWGSTTPTAPPQVAKLKQLVKAALADSQNWQAGLIPGTFAHVNFRKAETAAAGTPQPAVVRVAPNGILRFSQTVVPLDLTLDKFGQQQPDVKRFSVQSVKIGTIELKGKDMIDLFAADMFIKLSTDERISRPSFERMKSGFEVSDTTNALKIGSAQTIAVTGEVSDAGEQFVPGNRIQMKDRMKRIVRTSSATFRSAASADNKMRKGGYGAFEPAAKAKYAVATKADLKNHLNRTFSSYAEASEAMRNQPVAIRKKLQVVNNYELV